MTGRRGRAGFTLTELLIVGAVLSVVLGGMLVTLVNGQASYLFLETSVQVQEEARRAFDAMVREIREAGSVTLVTLLGGNSALDFQIPLGYNLTLNGCAASSICWGAFDGANQPQPGWHVQYHVETPTGQQAQLVREVLNNEGTSQLKRVLTTLVDGSATTFAITGDIVTINLQLSTPHNALLPGGVQSSAPLTAKISLRNPSA